MQKEPGKLEIDLKHGPYMFLFEHLILMYFEKIAVDRTAYYSFCLVVSFTYDT